MLRLRHVDDLNAVLLQRRGLVRIPVLMPSTDVRAVVDEGDATVVAQRGGAARLRHVGVPDQLEVAGRVVDGRTMNTDERSW